MIGRGMDKVVVRKGFVIAVSCLHPLKFWRLYKLGQCFTDLDRRVFVGTWTCHGNHLALCRLTLIPKPAVGQVTECRWSPPLCRHRGANRLRLAAGQNGQLHAPMQVIFVFLIIGALTPSSCLGRNGREAAGRRNGIS